MLVHGETLAKLISAVELIAGPLAATIHDVPDQLAVGRGSVYGKGACQQWQATTIGHRSVAVKALPSRVLGSDQSGLFRNLLPKDLGLEHHSRRAPREDPPGHII